MQCPGPTAWIGDRKSAGNAGELRAGSGERRRASHAHCATRLSARHTLQCNRAAAKLRADRCTLAVIFMKGALNFKGREGKWRGDFGRVRLARSQSRTIGRVRKARPRLPKAWGCRRSTGPASQGLWPPDRGWQSMQADLNAGAEALEKQGRLRTMFFSAECRQPVISCTAPKRGKDGGGIEVGLRGPTPPGFWRCISVPCRLRAGTAGVRVRVRALSDTCSTTLYRDACSIETLNVAQYPFCDICLHACQVRGPLI